MSEYFGDTYKLVPGMKLVFRPLSDIHDDWDQNLIRCGWNKGMDKLESSGVSLDATLDDVLRIELNKSDVILRKINDSFITKDMLIPVENNLMDSIYYSFIFVFYNLVKMLKTFLQKRTGKSIVSKLIAIWNKI